MKISVITACFNSENTLTDTILSVINQTYNDIEYIIIDGASTDKTLDIIEKYKKNITKIISESDNGIYDAMNKGVKYASGEYLLFLNSDDKLYDNTVLEKFGEFANKHKTDLVWGDLCLYNPYTQVKNIQKHNKFNKIYLIKNTPAQPSTFYKREIFDKIGLFSTNFKIVSDQEWFLRAFMTYKISWAYLPYPVNIFSSGGVSTSSQYEIKHAAERKQMFSMYFSNFGFKIYSFIAKYFRSITTMPMLKKLWEIK